MLECDVCVEWFHGECVGIENIYIEEDTIFKCPKCSGLNESTLNGKTMLEIQRIMQKIKRNIVRSRRDSKEEREFGDDEDGGGYTTSKRRRTSTSGASVSSAAYPSTPRSVGFPSTPRGTTASNSQSNAVPSNHLAALLYQQQQQQVQQAFTMNPLFQIYTILASAPKTNEDVLQRETVLAQVRSNPVVLAQLQALSTTIEQHQQAQRDHEQRQAKEAQQHQQLLSRQGPSVPSGDVGDDAFLLMGMAALAAAEKPSGEESQEAVHNPGAPVTSVSGADAGVSKESAGMDIEASSDVPQASEQ